MLTSGGVTGRAAFRSSATVRSSRSRSIQPQRNDKSAAITMPADTASPCSHVPAEPDARELASKTLWRSYCDVAVRHAEHRLSDKRADAVRQAEHSGGCPPRVRPMTDRRRALASDSSLRQLSTNCNMCQSRHYHGVVHESRKEWGRLPRTVSRDRLHGVAEGVAQVQGCPHAAFPLIDSHHLRLVHARPLDGVRQRLRSRAAQAITDEIRHHLHVLLNSNRCRRIRRGARTLQDDCTSRRAACHSERLVAVPHTIGFSDLGRVTRE